MTMTLVAVVVLGVVASGLIPVSLMPAIDIPRVTVQVSYDLPARELDAAIVKPLRYQLMQVSRLKDLTTESKDGVATVQMEFEPGADMDYLFIEVNEKIDRSMSGFPRDMDRPRVIKASATDIPAFYINVTLRGQDTAGRSDPLFPVSSRFMELSDFARQVLSKRIEQLPEVAMVDVSGGASPELLLIPDREKLEALGLSPRALAQVLEENRVQLGNLSVRDGEYYYNVRFRAAVTGREDMEGLFVKVHGRLYRLGDLARVVEHPQPRTGLVRSGGNEAVTFAVIKQADAKMADMRASLAALMESFERDYPDIRFEVIRDQTELLEYSIDNLRNNLLVGAALACLVIFLFMKDLRTPLLIALTVPLSLVVSLLLFYAFGISVNIISLSGLVLGIGMMVDNSIIVIDNVSQWWERGHTLRESVVGATREVFAPMLSSVLTTCSVFVPLIFLSGLAGALFYDQAMGVAISLFASLLVSVTVIPVYYYRLYRGRSGRRTSAFFRKMKGVDYVGIYEKGIKWSLRHRRLLTGFFFFSLGMVFVLFRVLPKERLPELTTDDILVNVEWNRSYPVADIDRYLDGALAEVKEEVAQETRLVGEQQFLLSHTRSIGQTESIIYLKAMSPDRLEGIKSRLTAYFHRHYPWAVVHFEPSGNIFDMVFSDREAELVARLRSTDGATPDPDRLNRLLGRLREALPGVYLEPVSWQEYVLLTTRPDRMALYGVDNSVLYSRLRSALDQDRLFTVTESGFSVPVVMGDRSGGFGEALETAGITRDSVYYPLSEFLVETRMKDFKQVVSGPEGNFYPLALDIPNDRVPEAVRRVGEAVQADPGFEVTFSGAYFSNREMTGELMIILTVALLLLYFILAAQFESLVQPAIILSEIVVDVFGAFLVLWAFGVSLNLMSMIGIVVMCGIVINDSILKIDTINRLRRREGYGLLRAIVQGGAMRIKPIIMTSLTTILAIAPFLVKGDMGSDLQYPLSVALIGGMVVGTLVSVFLVPVFYYIVYKKR